MNEDVPRTTEITHPPLLEWIGLKGHYVLWFIAFLGALDSCGDEIDKNQSRACLEARAAIAHNVPLHVPRECREY